ncbi:MAG: 3-phosphoshikimate 1-carboxyvinyltransferase [Clostridia bacterium]|nr:3-phosphoshikimate 1-carboxyvinyltransferase [Clostridia bacterium]
MIARIDKSDVNGKIKAIPSKSYAHRIAICNFLAGNAVSSGCVGFTSKDITATEECLKAVLSGKSVLDCGESGSTLRFLLPLMAARGGNYTFIGHGKLMDRPNDELLGALSCHGAVWEKTDRINLSGKLTSGDYRIRGDISSQYISGLLMALATLDGDSTITLLTPLSSAPYVDITLEVLSSYGIKIIKTDSGYFIKGGQKFKGNVTPEGDWSNAAFFVALGALSGKTEVFGLNLDSVQGDLAILEILKLAGAKIERSGDTVTVYKSRLKAFTIDAEDCPDLVPITAVIAANAKGTSVIKNVSRLKIKESDRIESTIVTLNAFGIKAEYTDGNLIVYGGLPKAGEIDSYNDHRIVMSAEVLATVCQGTSVIKNAQAVEKSYPTFFKDLQSVGGKVNV